MRVVLYCGTNKYLWAIRPFMYLFNKYCNIVRPITLVTTGLPDAPLPDNVEVWQLPQEMLKNGELEMHRFTTAHRWFLERLGQEVFGYFLPDQWIVEKVEMGMMVRLWHYTLITPMS